MKILTTRNHRHGSRQSNHHLNSRSHETECLTRGKKNGKHDHACTVNRASTHQSTVTRWWAWHYGKKYLSEKRLCFNCTDTRHRAAECRIVRSCQKCNGRHHTSICDSDSQQMLLAIGEGREDKESVTNYRPVSLLSCASKVMERCLLNKIYPILKNQMYYLQHGFIKGRSCTTQMVYVLHQLGKVLDCSGQIDVLYLVLGL